MDLFPSDTYWRDAANRDPEEEALGWVVRLTSGDVTKADQEEFDRWRADRDNSRAYARACRLWDGIGPVLEEQAARGWPNAGSEAVDRRPTVRRRSWSLHLTAIAAGVAAVCLVGHQYGRVWQYDYVSGTHVVEHVVLKDGSWLELGPDTALRSDFRNGTRHVTLARGEGFFDVRHDAEHPFVVSSGNGLVRVLGTAFSVRHMDDGSVTVTVARGRVQVVSGSRTAFLDPDRQITFNGGGLGGMRAVDSSLAMAWTRGRLIMENRPLGEVLAELDRYRPGILVLLNAEASQRRINAVIDLNRSDTWLRALAASQGLTLDDVGPVTLVR